MMNAATIEPETETQANPVDPTPRRVVIYHASCRDGFCAAWLIYQIYPDAEFLPYQYNDQAPHRSVYEDAEVFVVDFSFEQSVTMKMIQFSRSFVCLDHHKSAKGNLIGLPGCHFDMEKSGARMVWDYFRDKLRHRFVGHSHWLVDYTEDRDLWRFKLPFSREVNAALALVPFDFTEWDALEVFETMVYSNDGTIDGATVLRYIESQAKRLAAKADYIDLYCRNAHFVVPAVNVTDSNAISDTGAILAAPAGIGATYFHDGSDFVYSLRSRGEIDCSVIAQHYGGGGHKNAAGFKSATFPPAIPTEV